MIITAYLLFTVVSGSLLGFLLHTLFDYDYEKLLSRSILLIAAIGLVPLWRLFNLSAELIGLTVETPVQNLAAPARVYLFGLVALLPPMCFFVVVGFRVWDPGLTVISGEFLGQCVVIFLSAWLVAIFEETLFRGVLFTAIRRHAGYITAALISSLLYAAVHFLQPAAATLLEPSWFSGLTVVSSAFSGLLSAGGDWQSFVGLTLLGVMFCWVREHMNLWSAIFLHSAFVFGLRVYKELTVRDIVNPYATLAGEYDHFVGLLVSFWLLFGFVLIYLYRARTDFVR